MVEVIVTHYYDVDMCVREDLLECGGKGCIEAGGGEEGGDGLDAEDWVGQDCEVRGEGEEECRLADPGSVIGSRVSLNLGSC